MINKEDLMVLYWLGKYIAKLFITSYERKDFWADGIRSNKIERHYVSRDVDFTYWERSTLKTPDP